MEKLEKEVMPLLDGHDYEMLRMYYFAMRNSGINEFGNDVAVKRVLQVLNFLKSAEEKIDFKVFLRGTEDEVADDLQRNFRGTYKVTLKH